MYAVSFNMLIFSFHLQGPLSDLSKSRSSVIPFWSDFITGIKVFDLCTLSRTSVETRNLSKRLISLYVNCLLLGCICHHTSFLVSIRFLYVMELVSFISLRLYVSLLFSVKLKSPPIII